jgi:hypothetical protein
VRRHGSHAARISETRSRHRLLLPRRSEKKFRKKCHEWRGLVRTYIHQESAKALIEHSVRASQPRGRGQR